MGSTSEVVRSCSQVSPGACRLALLPGVLQSGGAGVLSAGSLQDVISQLHLAHKDIGVLFQSCCRNEQVILHLPALIAMVAPATIPMAGMLLLRGVGTGTGAG